MAKSFDYPAPIIEGWDRGTTICPHCSMRSRSERVCTGGKRRFGTPSLARPLFDPMRRSTVQTPGMALTSRSPQAGRAPFSDDVNPLDCLNCNDIYR